MHRTERKRVLAAAVAIMLAAYLSGSSAVPPAAQETATQAPAPTGITALPDAPEKAVILEHCDVCHGLEWILRSGGTERGWADRLRRMIRSGATITPGQIPALAAYLAKVLPVRPVPQDSTLR